MFVQCPTLCRLYWLGLCLLWSFSPDLCAAQNKLLDDPAALFQELDKDDDGKLSGDELPASHRDAALKEYDKNKDGKLDAREYLQLANKARADADAKKNPPKKAAGIDNQLPPGTRVLKDLAYVPNGHERQKLDLYLPPTGTAPRPLVIWIHGGGWRGGDKAQNPAQPMLKLGFAVASLNYRYTNHAPFPAQFEDCQAAIRFLREHAEEYQLDPERFGAWGASAGGHLTALIATYDEDQPRTGNRSSKKTSARVQAAVDWCGPTDFPAMATYAAQVTAQSIQNKDKNKADLAKFLVETLALCFGGAPNARTQKLMHDSSPVNFASKDDPPILLMHGDQDPVVPVAQSEVLHSALTKVGVDSTLQVIRGAGHGFATPGHYQTVEDFFVKHFKP